MRDCPNRDVKKVTPNVPKDDAPTERNFYAFQTRGEKTNEGDVDEGKSLNFSF